MDILFPRETEAKVYRWSLGVIHSRADLKKGSKQQVWFDISHNGSLGNVLADNFDACLSLWNYTIQQKEQQSGEGGRLRGPVDKEDDTWLRNRRPGMCFRLLGLKSKQLIQDLKWWAPQGTETVIEVNEITEFEPKGVKEPLNERIFKTVDCSRVVGYSPSVQTPRSNVSGLQTLDIDGSFLRMGTGEISLAIETRDSLVDLYAKDLLFSFMCSAVNTLEEPIPSKTEIRPAGVQFSPDSVFSLWNQDLAELAEAFRELGFGHGQEAFIGIVAPLSIAETLPFPLVGLSAGHLKRNTDDFFHYLAYLYKEQCRQMSIGVKRLEDSVKRLEEVSISEKPPPFPDYFNLTELHYAAMSTSETKLMDILESGNLSFEYVNKRYICHWTALHYAAARGDLAFIGKLSSHSSGVYKLVDPNMRDFRGYTTLHYACEQDHKGTVVELLYRGFGASFEAHAWNGVTPMHLAAGNRSREVMERIEKCFVTGYRGIKRPNSLMDSNGRLLIHWTVMGGQVMNLRTFEYEINGTDNLGWTPLHLAVVYDQLEVVGELLNLFADKEKKDKAGRTALYLACERENLAALRILYEAGADCTSAANNGKTPLHEAAALQPEEVRLAREQGSAEFPLARDYGSGIELVKVLVSGQANTESEDDRGRTPINVAENEGHTEVLSYLH
ncbi:hypothetical protein FSARC_1960 [Fusarium sarcochroum]|uniref:Ankyrin n=1 Tax=Fusarium sarcochroum TaxID=1208366 RepID=A0A8H4U7N2_9HYPO|nr:hypothetical protein FSARC_1960 [Fusarium sarcochroum]